MQPITEQPTIQYCTVYYIH